MRREAVNAPPKRSRTRIREDRVRAIEFRSNPSEKQGTCFARDHGLREWGRSAGRLAEKITASPDGSEAITPSAQQQRPSPCADGQRPYGEPYERA